jgi:hypothetical protein
LLHAGLQTCGALAARLAAWHVCDGHGAAPVYGAFVALVSARATTVLVLACCVPMRAWARSVQQSVGLPHACA